MMVQIELSELNRLVAIEEGLKKAVNEAEKVIENTKKSNFRIRLEEEMKKKEEESK